MVSISECLLTATGMLKPVVENPRSEAEFFMAHILQKDRMYIVVHRDELLDQSITDRFFELIKRRSSGEPAAYITGIKEFMSLSFSVCPDVLIPRPETEMLVEHITEKYSDFDNLHIIDICTGSGAIACSLAHYMPDATVHGIDISPAAVKTAIQNARSNSVLSNTKFWTADALKPVESDIIYDVVVSNPPYIESEVIDTLMPDVRDYEPHLALDGGADGLIFYRNIVDNIEHILQKKGELVFEIGYNQADSVVSIMKNKFSDIHVCKDCFGNDRMVFGQLE